MTSYVVGFLYSRMFNKILLVNKVKPDWQKHLWNGIGGKIEPTDTNDFAAMEREFQEETGCKDDLLWQKMGIIEDTHGFWRVAIFKCEVRYFPIIPNTGNDVGEDIAVHDLMTLTSDREDLILNLRWLVPMLIYDTNVQFEVIDYGE